MPRLRRAVIHTVTDARRPMSKDIGHRERRYLVMMAVRTACFLLAIFALHGVWRFVGAVAAFVLPYFAVVFANGGRESEPSPTFTSQTGDDQRGRELPAPRREIES